MIHNCGLKLRKGSGPTKIVPSSTRAQPNKQIVFSLIFYKNNVPKEIKGIKINDTALKIAVNEAKRSHGPLIHTAFPSADW